MMPRYTNVDKLWKNIDKHLEREPVEKHLFHLIINEVGWERIDPVKHAHWIVENESDSFGDHYRTYYTCSKCKHLTFKGWNFCPDCGAKMDEEDS